MWGIPSALKTQQNAPCGTLAAEGVALKNTPSAKNGETFRAQGNSRARASRSSSSRSVRAVAAEPRYARRRRRALYRLDWLFFFVFLQSRSAASAPGAQPWWWNGRHEGLRHNLSALSEKRDVECRKFKETSTGKTEGNLEPSL